MVLVIVGCWTMMTFFRADDLIGAVGLRAVYRDYAWILAVLALFLLLVISLKNQLTRWYSILGVMLLFFVTAVVVVASLFIFWMFISLFWSFIPAWMILFGFVCSITVFVLVKLHPEWFSSVWVTNLMLTSLVVAALFFVGATVDFVDAETQTIERLAWNGENYLLQIQYGFLPNDSIPVFLYRCNAFEFDCRQIHYENLWDSTPYRTVDLRLEGDAVNIWLDDRLLYRYMPDS
jgi:hypothetical protein